MATKKKSDNDSVVVNSGTLAYKGEEGFEHQKVVRGGNRPILLPRNGPVKVKRALELEIRRAKKDKTMLMVYAKLELTKIDDKDTVPEGAIIQSYSVFSGNYGPQAKRAGQPKVHVLRDVLLSFGVAEATVIKQVPVGSGKVNLANIAKAFENIVKKGLGAAVNVYAEEGNGEYAGTWSSSVNSWIPPKEFTDGIVGGYDSPLQPQAKAWLENPTPAKGKKKRGAFDEGEGEDLLDDEGDDDLLGGDDDAGDEADEGSDESGDDEGSDEDDLFGS